jgi:hypothetical protein
MHLGAWAQAVVDPSSLNDPRERGATTQASALSTRRHDASALHQLDRLERLDEVARRQRRGARARPHERQCLRHAWLKPTAGERQRARSALDVENLQSVPLTR